MWHVILDNIGIKSMKRENGSDQMALPKDASEKLVEWEQPSPLSPMALKQSGNWSEGHSDGDDLDNEFDDDMERDDTLANDPASCCVSERFLSDVVKSAPPPTPCLKYNLGSKVRFLQSQMKARQASTVPAGGCRLQDTRYCDASTSCVTCVCTGERIVYPATIVSIGRAGYCLRMEDGGMMHDIDVENISDLDEASPRPLMEGHPIPVGESAEPKCVSPMSHANTSPPLAKSSAKRRPIFASINLRSLLRLLQKKKYKLRLKRISRHLPANDEPVLAGVTQLEKGSGRLRQDDLEFVNDRDSRYLSKSLSHIIGYDGGCQIAEAKS